MRRLRLLQVAAFAVCVAAGMTGAIAWSRGTAALPALARVVAEHDITRVMADIDATNGDIGKVNQHILTTLEQVQSDTARVDRVHQRLLHLEALVTQQNSQLDQLARGAAEQAELSRELQAVTASIRPATEAMAETAAAQAEQVEAMGATTRRLADRLRTVNAVNRSTAEKLEQVAELSALVLGRMP